MNGRRTFLKTSSALMVTRMFTPSWSAWAQGSRLTNWSGNLTYGTDNVFYPRSDYEVVQMVKKHAKLKVLGTRHCFNDIADSPDNLISLREMNHVIDLDAKAQTVTVAGGINYGQLCPELDRKGFALHNLATLPRTSVAGACATATHGSGVKTEIWRRPSQHCSWWPRTGRSCPSRRIRM